MTHPTHPAAAPELSSQNQLGAVSLPDSVLLGEISTLRERGLSDEAILNLLSGFNIEARPEPCGPHWDRPRHYQLIRLIWGQSNPFAIFRD
jgi:hypothetical protein